MAEFKPLKGLRQKVYDALLRGDIIKKDGGASTRMQIIPRDQKNHTEVLHTQVTNIGFNRGGVSDIPGAEFIPYMDISGVAEQLENEGYTVASENVYSGCCQYHTRIFYLVGE